MNKALHALVYLILAVSVAALYFEYNLYGKKELLKDRNRQLEDCLVTLSKTIEKADPAKPATVPEARKDVSQIEAKAVESPETENLLEDYPAQFEEQNLDKLNWGDKERIQSRQLYKLDGEGNKIPDAANPGDFVKKGPGTAQELLDKIVDRAKAQQTALNNTRAELANVRSKLEKLVSDFNKLPPEMRQDKITIEEKKKQIEELEAKKTELEENISKLKTQIEDLNTEIKSVKEELQASKDETEQVREELAKEKKKTDHLNKIIQEMNARLQGGQGQTSAGTNVTAGNKGKIVDINTSYMFAVIEFTDEAMKELIGPERNGVLPQIEMGIRRKGFNGPAGEFVGRVRLRQCVAGKNFVIADVLGDWQQAVAQKGDDVFSE
jgi:outer membrane murein-binding lipoprotein Lpp